MRILLLFIKNIIINKYIFLRKMERYFTTIALLGVDEGNLPVHRGMR